MKRKMFTVKVQYWRGGNPEVEIVRLGAVHSNNAGMARGKEAIRNRGQGSWYIDAENSTVGELRLQNTKNPNLYAAIIVKEVI